MNSRYWSVAALLIVVSIPIGCTALSDRNDDRPKVEVTRLLPEEAAGGDGGPAFNKKVEELFLESLKKPRESDRLFKVPFAEPNQTSQQCCKPTPPSTVPAVSAPSTTHVPTTATPAVVASVASAASPASVLPQSVARGSKVGDYHFWINFGYQNGILVYKPFWGTSKSVVMTERLVRFTYKCTALLPETDHVATVVVTATVKPAVLFEEEFHRFVASYATVGGKHGDKNVVTPEDLESGALKYLGKQHEDVCVATKTRSLSDMLDDPSLGFAKVLNGIIAVDQRSPFDIFVQTTKVELPDEFMRALAKKGLKQPLAQKLIVPQVAKRKLVPQQKCCACVQHCTLPR